MAPGRYELRVRQSRCRVHINFFVKRDYVATPTSVHF